MLILQTCAIDASVISGHGFINFWNKIAALKQQQKLYDMSHITLDLY